MPRSWRGLLPPGLGGPLVAFLVFLSAGVPGIAAAPGGRDKLRPSGREGLRLGRPNQKSAEQDGGAASQTPPPSGEQGVRLKAELVEVHADVVDKSGNFVPGLTKEDFAVQDDGRPQQVSFFSLQGVAGRGSAAPGTGVTAPAVYPVAPQTGQPAGPPRTVAFFFDTLHLSPEDLIAARKSVRSFVEHQMSGSDLAAVVTGTGELGLLEQFTRDRSVLLMALNRLGPPILSPKTLLNPLLAADVIRNDGRAITLANAIISSEQAFTPSPGQVEMIAEQTVQFEGYSRRASASVLTALSKMMAAMPGDRMIVVLSDGFSKAEEAAGDGLADLAPAITTATRSGVVVYSVQASGLEVSSLLQASSPGLAAGSVLPRGGRGYRPISMPMNPLAGAISYDSAYRADRQAVLQALAESTGGRAYLNNNDLGGEVLSALARPAQYYSLAFYPSERRGGKSFHRVEVRIKSHPDYKVIALKGYLEEPAAALLEQEPAKTPAAALVAAMFSPLASAGIDVGVQASFLDSAADQAQVTLNVLIGGGSVSFAQKPDGFAVGLQVGIAIQDHSGKSVGTYLDDLKTALTAAQHAQALVDGFTYTKRYKLKPGLYLVRVGILEPGTGKIGTSNAWVEVADTGPGRFAVSSLVLRELSAPAGAAARSAKTSGDTAGTGGTLRPPTQSSPASPQQALGTTASQAGQGAKADAQQAEYFSPRVSHGTQAFRQGDSLAYYLVIYAGPAGKADPPNLAMRTELLQADRSLYQSDWRPVTERAVQTQAGRVEIGGRLALAVPPGVYELKVTVKNMKSGKLTERSDVFAVSQ